MLDFWRRRDELVVELKGPQNFVSHADRAVEGMIRDAPARHVLRKRGAVGNGKDRALRPLRAH